MELMDAIRGRRSLRSFTSTPVQHESLQRLVAAASYAPSRWNVQPWHFHIATGAARKQVAEVMAMNTAYVQEYLDVHGPEVIEAAARFYADLGGAPVVIGISAERVENALDRLDDTISVGASLQNFLLAVVEEGLAACSLTAPDWIRGQLLEAFQIPEGSDLMALIVVGYSDEEPRPKDRNTDIATYLT